MNKKIINNKPHSEIPDFAPVKELDTPETSWPNRRKELAINLKDAQPQIKTNAQQLKSILRKDNDIPLITLNKSCPQIARKLTALKIYFTHELYPETPKELTAEFSIIKNNLLNNIALVEKLLNNPNTSPEVLINLLVYIDRSIKDITTQKPYFKTVNQELLKKTTLSLDELYSLLNYKKDSFYKNISPKSEQIKGQIKAIKNIFTSGHKYYSHAVMLQTLVNEYTSTYSSIKELKQAFTQVLKQQHHSNIKDFELARLSRNFMLQLQSKEKQLETLFNRIGQHVNFLNNEIIDFIIYQNADSALSVFFNNNPALTAEQRNLISRTLEQLITVLLQNAAQLSYPVVNKIAQKINELLIKDTEKQKLLDLLQKYYQQLSKRVAATEAKAAA